MIKETRQVIRDPSSIAIGVVLPMILILLFGYGLSLDVKNVPVALVVEDSGPAARELSPRPLGQDMRNGNSRDDRRSRERSVERAGQVSKRLRQRPGRRVDQRLHLHDPIGNRISLGAGVRFFRLAPSASRLAPSS